VRAAPGISMSVIATAAGLGTRTNGAKHAAPAVAIAAACDHSNFMSRHFETSEPRPEEMMMQPRTLRAVLSLAHTA